MADHLNNARYAGQDANVLMPDGVRYIGPVWLRKGADPEPSRFFVLYRNQPVGIAWSVAQGGFVVLRRPSAACGAMVSNCCGN